MERVESPDNSLRIGSFSIPKLSVLIFPLVFILALVLRLSGLSSMEFKDDEQKALRLGIDLLTQRPWATSAPWPSTGDLSSVGIYNPPLFRWIIALFWRLTANPLGVAGLIAIANAISIYPLYRWIARLCSERRALFFAAWMAVSPFAVFYSRKIWASEMLLPGFACLVWGFEWLRGGRFWRGVVLLIFAILFVSELHGSGPILLACIPVAILVQYFVERQRPVPLRLARPTWREGIAIVVGLIFLFLNTFPYVGYLLSLPASAFVSHANYSWTRPEFFEWLVKVLLGSNLSYHFEPEWEEFIALRGALWFGGAVLTGIPLAVFGLHAWFRTPQRIPVLGYLWIVFILVVTLVRHMVSPHYLLILSPLPALLFSGAFEKKGSEIYRMDLLRGIHLIFLLGLTVSALGWAADRGGSTGDYGITYSYRLQQADAILAGTGVLDPASSKEWPRCYPIPSEVRWLMLWKSGKDPMTTVPPPNLSICDGWQGDESLHYRWTLIGKSIDP